MGDARRDLDALHIADRAPPRLLIQPGHVAWLQGVALLLLVEVGWEQESVARRDLEFAALLADAALAKQDHLPALAQGADGDGPLLQRYADRLGQAREL